jgi:CRP-like cAMP-binding protein
MNVKIFSKLTKREEDFLLENSQFLSVKRGEILHSPKDKIEHVSVVLKGSLRVLKYFTNGNEQSLKCVKKNETFGESLVFAKQNYPAYIVALEDSKVLEIPYEIIIELFSNKEFMKVYLGEIGNKVFNLSSVIEWLLVKPVEERLMKYLCFLCRVQNSDVVYFKSKQSIASDIGSVREVISRKFKSLEKKKIIEIIDAHHVKVLIDFLNC